jgi:hypothetical protein
VSTCGHAAAAAIAARSAPSASGAPSRGDATRHATTPARATSPPWPPLALPPRCGRGRIARSFPRQIGRPSVERREARGVELRKEGTRTYYHYLLPTTTIACYQAGLHVLLTTNYTSHYLRDEGARGLTPSAGAMARREGEQHQHAAAHAVACGACAKWPSGAAPQGSLGQPAAYAALASHIGLAFSTECATCRSGDLVATRRRGPRATAAASCCSAARRPVQTSLAAAAPLAAGAACR